MEYTPGKRPSSGGELIEYMNATIDPNGSAYYNEGRTITVKPTKSGLVDMNTQLYVDIPNLREFNVKKGVNIVGAIGEYEGSIEPPTGNAIPALVLEGVTFSSSSGANPKTGTMKSQSGKLVMLTPNSVNGTQVRAKLATEDVGAFDSATTLAISDPNFIAANIRAGKTLFGLAGTLPVVTPSVLKSYDQYRVNNRINLNPTGIQERVILTDIAASLELYSFTSGSSATIPWSYLQKTGDVRDFLVLKDRASSDSITGDGITIFSYTTSGTAHNTIRILNVQICFGLNKAFVTWVNDALGTSGTVITNLTGIDRSKFYKVSHRTTSYTDTQSTTQRTTETYFEGTELKI